MEGRNKFIDICLGLLFFYVLLIIVYVIVLSKQLPGFTERGQFGDMFGAFNAFFAGLALIGVVVTLWKQHYIQVENTFFSMLTLLQQIISSANLKITNATGPDIVYSGREYFKYTFETFENFYKGQVYRDYQNVYNMGGKEIRINNSNMPTLSSEEYKKPLIECYEEIYKNNDYNLGHYFRYIFNIVKYVRESFPEDKVAQNKYIGLLQAQLSNDEMALIFYNALSKHGKNVEGKELFREWLDEYDFFQNIDRRCIFHTSFTEYYPKTNFKFLTQ